MFNNNDYNSVTTCTSDTIEFDFGKSFCRQFTILKSSNYQESFFYYIRNSEKKYDENKSSDFTCPLNHESFNHLGLGNPFVLHDGNNTKINGQRYA